MCPKIVAPLSWCAPFSELVPHVVRVVMPQTNNSVTLYHNSLHNNNHFSKSKVATCLTKACWLNVNYCHLVPTINTLCETCGSLITGDCSISLGVQWLWILIHFPALTKYLEHIMCNSDGERWPILQPSDLWQSCHFFFMYMDIPLNTKWIILPSCMDISNCTTDIYHLWAFITTFYMFPGFHTQETSQYSEVM